MLPGVISEDTKPFGGDTALFRPVYSIGEPATTFHPLPWLPSKIRDLIWTKSLQRQRLIPVVTCPEAKSPISSELPGLAHADEEERTAGGYPYKAIVSCHSTYSKLLRVNKDSRSATLSFYRVHIPCHIERKEAETLDADDSISIHPVVYISTQNTIL